MNSIIDQNNVTGPPCEFCGSPDTYIAFLPQEFEYKHGKAIQLLSAKVPTITCLNCEECYLAEGAEELKHAVVCCFLDRLTPKEIVAKRNALRMSQAGLAKATGIGIASIKRWETGALIQSAALDKRLRDCCDATLLAKTTHPWTPTFRTPVREESRIRAASFSLRPNDAYLQDAA